MYRFIAALIAIFAAQTKADAIWKCCGFGEVLNPNYGCERDLTKRLQVSTNLTNFFAEKTDGNCSEATEDGILNLWLQGSEIVAESLTKGRFFPKCCPLGYFYDALLHSCAEKGDYQHGFVEGDFVEVGLPHCKVIVDLAGPDSGLDGVDYCLDEDGNGEMIRRECRNDTKVCEEQLCVKKCCPDGKSFVGGKNCLDTYTHGVDLRFSSNVEDPTDNIGQIEHSEIVNPNSKHHEAFKIMYVNCQCITNKTDQVEILILEENPHILCFSESWCNESNIGTFQFKNYAVRSIVME